MTMDIAISAHRNGGRNLVWLAYCYVDKAWVVGASPGEWEKLMRKLRGALIGEFATSGGAFRAAWGKLVQPRHERIHARRAGVADASTSG
jgi:hypothetical protein